MIIFVSIIVIIIILASSVTNREKYLPISQECYGISEIYVAKAASPSG